MDFSEQYGPNLAKIYATQATARANEDPGRTFLKQAMASQDRRSVVVDIGCGSGIDLLAYHQMGFSHLWGLDSSLPALQEAQQTVGNRAQWIHGKIEQLPFNKQSIDILTSRFSFIYCPQIDQGIMEVARVLKPGGHFIAVVPHPLRDARIPRHPDGTITASFFHGAVTTTYPAHTMDDYLGPVFQRFFNLERVEAFSDRASAGYVTKEIVEAPPDEPTVLCFSASRKA